MADIDIEKTERALREDAELFREIAQKHGNGKIPQTVLDEGFIEAFREYESLIFKEATYGNHRKKDYRM